MTHEPRVSFCPASSIGSECTPVEGRTSVPGGTTLIANDLTPALLEAIATRAFGVPGLLRCARPLGGGTVNIVQVLELVGKPPAILRIAPSVAAANDGPSWLTPWGLRREQAVMALLPHLNHMLPPTIYADFSRTLIDRDWVVQGFVQGEAWSELTTANRLTTDHERDLWAQTGALLRSIHDVKGRHFGAVGEPETGLRDEHWSTIVQADAGGLLDDARRYALVDAVPMLADFVQAVAQYQPVLDAIRIPALTHSDLDPRHIFVAPDATGRYTITGLIDLEFGRFADPQSESLLVGMELAPPSPAYLCAFREGYGPLATPDGAEIRALIYQAIATGWELTDLARLDRRYEIPPVTARLHRLLHDLTTRPR